MVMYQTNGIKLIHINITLFLLSIRNLDANAIYNSFLQTTNYIHLASQNQHNKFPTYIINCFPFIFWYSSPFFSLYKCRAVNPNAGLREQGSGVELCKTQIIFFWGHHSFGVNQISSARNCMCYGTQMENRV
jgi:hypothetical protein